MVGVKALTKFERVETMNDRPRVVDSWKEGCEDYRIVFTGTQYELQRWYASRWYAENSKFQVLASRLDKWINGS